MQQNPQQMPNDQELERQYRQYTQGPQPGGRATRGPAIHAGGSNTEPQGPVPPYEGRKQHADTLDAPYPPQATGENVMGSGGIRQATEQPSVPTPQNREAELNMNTGTDASAEEIKQRIESGGPFR